MSKKLYEEANISDIADAIREKNGTQNQYTVAQMSSAVRAIHAQGEAVVQPLSVTQNGTYNPPSGVDGYAPVTVNVSGGGSGVKFFEVYAADNFGFERTEKGYMDNQYFACFFHDNMSDAYILNGETFPFMIGSGCNTQTKAATRAVSENTSAVSNAIAKNGSSFSTSHYDVGSYISVVGGWYGWPSGGTIYEQMANGTTNTITMNEAHKTLLLFVGASQRYNAVSSVDINGVSYSIDNIGTRYDNVYGEYGAIEINNNSDTTITVTFPISCYNYVSIIGIDA